MRIKCGSFTQHNIIMVRTKDVEEIHAAIDKITLKYHKLLKAYRHAKIDMEIAALLMHR